MTKIIKNLTVLAVVLSVVSILPASALAMSLCAAPDGYFGYCTGEGGDNSTVNNGTGGGSTGGGSTGGGTVAGDVTLGVNSEVCVFNEAATTVTGITDGALIRAQGDIDVYIVKYVCNKKFKRLVLSPHVFESYGHFNWDDVLTVNQSTLNSFTTSTFVRATSAGDPKVYMLTPNGDTGEKRWVTSETVFLNRDWDWDSIYTINTTDRDAYVTGSPITS